MGRVTGIVERGERTSKSRNCNSTGFLSENRGREEKRKEEQTGEWGGLVTTHSLAGKPK